jgi:hypothetical protein
VIDRKATDLPEETFDHGITYVSRSKDSFVAMVDGSNWIGGRRARALSELAVRCTPFRSQKLAASRLASTRK